MAENRLTEKQRRFAEAYLQLQNASAAARAAGYSQWRSGYKILRSAAVQRYLRERQARDEPGEPGPVASAQEVLEYLTGVLRGEAEGESRQGAATPRMKAAELLGKRLGIFNEAPEPAAAPVIIDDIAPPKADG